MLARQILVAFLAVLIPSMLLLGAVTLYSLASLGAVNEELVQIMHAREAVADLHLTVARVGAPLGAFLLSGGRENREQFEDLVRQAETKLQSCATAACHASLDRPARMLATLRPLVDRLAEDGQRIFGAGPDEGVARAEAVRQTVAGVERAVEPMLAAVRRRGDQLTLEAAGVGRRVWGLTVSLVVLIALGGSAAAVIIARRMTRPLADLVAGTRRIMAGDWNVQVRTDSPGEIGELASSFNRMVQTVKQSGETLADHNRVLEERVRQRTEELGRKEQQELLQSERLASLGLLAAGVAHELNNPLTSIVMNASLLMEEVDGSSNVQRVLQQIDTDAARCRRIIDDLRAFARLRQVEKVPGEVALVVRQAASVVAHEIAGRAIDLRVDLSPDLPRVTWDPARMVQVLTNLLVNAAQAVGHGGQVIVRARGDDGWLRLEVEDDGPGIPAAQRRRIFDPFYTTKPDGTGLGLSISYGIVDEHGGRIEVESRTREEAGAGGQTGTTMRVLLPIGRGTA